MQEKGKTKKIRSEQRQDMRLKTEVTLEKETESEGVKRDKDEACF